MTTTPANDSAAAVIAAMLSDYMALYFGKREELEAGRTAFAAILDRLERVESENARLKALCQSAATTLYSEAYACAYTVQGKQVSRKVANLVEKLKATALLAADESEESKSPG